MLPGTASLVEQLDKKVMIVLRDGRYFVGMMRSFDQFSNIVLQDAFERHYVEDKYGDIPVGLFIIRGESIVLLGELSPEKEASQANLIKVSPQEIIEAEREYRQKTESSRGTKKIGRRKPFDFERLEV